MPIIPVYKYKRQDGGITVSPVKPSKKYTKMYRLVANEGKVFVNGDAVTTCLDVDSLEGWTEVDVPEQYNKEVT